MKKRRILYLLLAICLLVSRCSKTPKDKSVNALVIHKDHRIKSTIVESFDKEYYKEEELKTSIENQINEYNSQTGQESIQLESLKKKGKEIQLSMEYESAKDYASFNEVPLFEGTVEEAIAEGYDFSNTFQSIKKGKVQKQGLTSDEIKELSDHKVVIIKEYVQVEVPKNITAISGNMTLLNKKEAKVIQNHKKVAEDLTESDETKDESETEEADGVPILEPNQYVASYGYILYKE